MKYTDSDYEKLVEAIADFRANVEGKRDGLMEVIEDEPQWAEKYKPIIQTYNAILTDLTHVEHRIKP